MIVQLVKVYDEHGRNILTMTGQQNMERHDMDTLQKHTSSKGTLTNYVSAVIVTIQVEFVESIIDIMKRIFTNLNVKETD